MKWKGSKLVVAAVGLVVLSGCITSEPISYSGMDDPPDPTTGTTGTGSAWVRPRGAEFDDVTLDEVRPRTLDEKFWPELPIDKISQIHKYMTVEELEALLGTPDFKDVFTVGVDTPRDYNACVFTWKYQDSRYSSVALARDLRVRLAHVDRDLILPQRPEIEGDAWVVMGHDLY